MFENVAEHLDEAVSLAERCPEKYQIPCFQALIGVLAQSDALPSLADLGQDEHFATHSLNGGANPSTINANNANGRPDPRHEAGDNGSIFLQQFEIADDYVSRVYHRNGDSYRIIAKDLKEKTNSKKQIKLALLLGVGGLLSDGQPLFSKERLIETCREYGAYDGPNFASHMKKQRDLFIQQGNEWTLTKPGQQRAAEAIKELAS